MKIARNEKKKNEERERKRNYKQESVGRAINQAALKGPFDRWKRVDCGDCGRLHVADSQSGCGVMHKVQMTLNKDVAKAGKLAPSSSFTKKRGRNK